MAARSPVALIIGAGPNIGQSVVRKFASNGYKIGLAARSVKEADSTDSQLNIPVDLTKTDDVVKAFDQLKNTFGIPSVVVYNGKCASLTTRRSSI
jgi:NAD(P)-dependent dehydrogenase (short-subunit alcohol dehydrogenase family)